MATRIKITPEQIRGVAHEFRNASAQSEDMVNRLETNIVGMESDWEGLTKEHFYQQFQDWKKTMVHFVQLLDGINRQLVSIAGDFEEVDRRRRA